MAVSIKIDVDAAALIRRLRDDRFVRDPIRRGLSEIGLIAESEAKRRAPVDSNKLRASITHRIDDSPMMMFVEYGVIGPDLKNASYAMYMEYGTGLMHDHPNWPRKAHVVKPGHLLNWGPVKRKKTFPGVAKYITERGGLRPRRYLRGTLEANNRRFVNIIRVSLREIRL